MSIRFACGLVVALSLAGLAGPVLAEDGRRPTLVLHDTVSRAVEQDLLVAELCVRAESDSGDRSQELVDAALAAALEKVMASQGIRHLKKGGYRVFQAQHGQDAAGAWVVEQAMTIKAKESASVLQLLERLRADGLVLARLSYELSPEVRRSVEDELATEAIAALQARGQQLADQVGMEVDWIEGLRVAGVLDRPPLQLGLTAPAPELEANTLPIALPGHETVSITVDLELGLTGR